MKKLASRNSQECQKNILHTSNRYNGEVTSYCLVGKGGRVAVIEKVVDSPSR